MSKVPSTYTLGDYAFSDDGRYMAYQLKNKGSDWATIWVKDTVLMATFKKSD